MRKILTLVIIFLFNLSLFSQNKYYVAPSGTDANGFGSLNNPYKTVTYASSFLQAGDTLFVKSGTYTNPNFGNNDYWKDEQAVRISNVNGTANSYIVIIPYNNQKVIFKGDGSMIFNVRNSSYLKVLGFEVYGETENIPLTLAQNYQFAFRRNSLTNNIEYRLPNSFNRDTSGLEDISNLTIYRPFYFFTHGILVQNSHHIDVNNNLVHHVPGEGIRFASSDYINCIGNEVHNCSRRSATGVHGISCYTMTSIDNNDATKILFANNLVHDNYNEVMSWSELKTIFTAVLDEGKGLTIQRTTASRGWLHGRIRYENNIAYNNGFSGISLNEGERVDIVNNTCYNNFYTGRGSNIGISFSGSNDVIVANNIVVAVNNWGGDAITESGSSNIQVINNLVNGTVDPALKTTQINTIFADPKFVNVSLKNFNLQTTSLGINSGSSILYSLKDYSNTSRDNEPDRGALEFTPSCICN